MKVVQRWLGRFGGLGFEGSVLVKKGGFCIRGRHFLRGKYHGASIRTFGNCIARELVGWGTCRCVVAGPRRSEMSWRLRLSHGLNLDIPVLNWQLQKEPWLQVLRVQAGSSNDPCLHVTSVRLVSPSLFCHNNSFSPSSCTRFLLNLLSFPLCCTSGSRLKSLCGTGGGC